MAGNSHQDNHDKMKVLARILSNTVKDGTGTYYYPLLDSAGHLQIDVISTSAEHAEDAGHSSGDKGVMALAVRKDTAAALAGTDGDYIPLIVDDLGKLWVQTGTVTVTATDLDIRNLSFGQDVVQARQSIAASLKTEPAGNISHGAGDGGNPLKIGAKAIDYEPDSTGEQGFAEVATNDRANIATNLRGELVTAVKPGYVEPDNVDTTYDDDPTTATSSWYECWWARWLTVGFELTYTGTPTAMLVEIEFDLGDGNEKKYTKGPVGDWRFSAANIGAGIKRCYGLRIGADRFRLKTTATGTDVDNTITMANTVAYLRT